MLQQRPIRAAVAQQDEHNADVRRALKESKPMNPPPEPAERPARATAMSRIGPLLALARGEAVPLLLLSGVAGAAVLFIHLAEELADGETHAFDLWLLNLLRTSPSDPVGPAWLERMMLDITSLGSLSVIGVVAVLAVGYLLIERQRVEAVALVVAAGGGLLWSQFLKGVFERDRPPPDYRLVETLNASFPSGHALLATVFYLTLGALLARAMPRRRLKAYVIGAALALAVLVGVSRVYLGAHWPTDVLAGWCVGAAWSSACWLAEYVLLRRRRIRDGQPAARWRDAAGGSPPR